MTARGHSVTLVTAKSAHLPPVETLDNVEIRRVASPLGPHIKAANLLVGKSRYDVVVDDLAHVVPWGSNWVGRTPVVVYFRHLHARTLGGQVGPAAAWMLSRVERFYPTLYPTQWFVTISNQSKSDLVKLGVSADRICVIRPAVDTSVFVSGVKRELPELVHFSGLRPYKRADHAVRLAAELRERGKVVHLTIVGDGPSRPGLEEQARDSAVAASFPGRIGIGELATLVGSAWINVQTSVAEGWGLTASEACSAGVPTVGYAVPGLTEAVKLGETGLLVPEGHMQELADATIRILSDWEVWHERCIARRPLLSWELATDHWERILNKAIEANRQRVVS